MTTYLFEYILFNYNKRTDLHKFKKWFSSLPQRDFVTYKEIGYDVINGRGIWEQPKPQGVVNKLRFEIVVNNTDPEVQQEINILVRKGITSNIENIVLLKPIPSCVVNGHHLP